MIQDWQQSNQNNTTAPLKKHITPKYTLSAIDDDILSYSTRSHSYFQNTNDSLQDIQDPILKSLMKEVIKENDLQNFRRSHIKKSQKQRASFIEIIGSKILENNTIQGIINKVVSRKDEFTINLQIKDEFFTFCGSDDNLFESQPNSIEIKDFDGDLFLLDNSESIVFHEIEDQEVKQEEKAGVLNKNNAIKQTHQRQFSKFLDDDDS
ncbi:UNKNOWN [Stylonychia lemnae]|uniref:Uncharacterized protein n=1 Tax=Stylonychia lemnae TaxID=5949 RepID=A0A077ZUL9_STYLE|nr:UNKNOWN [Stylonychia lemnae]|eukprot:CDW73005.1 UNKNOWN [Stylonychia lemnae]